MGGVKKLFKPDMPKMPDIKPVEPTVVRMPSQNDPAIEEERRRRMALEQQQKGRESTRLSESAGVKPAYTGGVLGA